MTVYIVSGGLVFCTVIHFRKPELFPNRAFDAVASAIFNRPFTGTSGAIETFVRPFGITEARRTIALHTYAEIFAVIFNLCHKIQISFR